MCKKIHRGGNAEQYHADKKYKEAVAEAVEACADDTKGQTCFICTQALHWKTKEGLVRGCSCRGTAGFAHVSCLAEQAKILVAEAEENNLGWEVIQDRMFRWGECGLCEQRYHGVVLHALGWACWKTYLGRPDRYIVKYLAILDVAAGLKAAKKVEEALAAYEAAYALAETRTQDKNSDVFIACRANMAGCLDKLGRHDEARALERECYAQCVALRGEKSREALTMAFNIAMHLTDTMQIAEALPFLRKQLPLTDELGPDHLVTLGLRRLYARAIMTDMAKNDSGNDASDFCEAFAILNDLCKRYTRVLGAQHPETIFARELLEVSRPVAESADVLVDIRKKKAAILRAADGA